MVEWRRCESWEGDSANGLQSVSLWLSDSLVGKSRLSDYCPIEGSRDDCQLLSRHSESVEYLCSC
jgi:hypothetical protein